MFFHRTALKLKTQKGFTFIEIIIVLGITSILFGVMTFNLLRFKNSSSSQSNIDTLVSDLKNQQLKAMLGNTEGRAANDSYGIYFLSDKYILFHGTSYNPNDSANFPVNLPTDVQIQSTTLPNNTVVFTKISGEIPSFAQGSNTVTVKAVNINVQKVITFNRYGVITGVN
jgi:prepilin-type N-terminal cleavage/methylation domain-containing protein